MANGSERADGRTGLGTRLHACLRVLAVLVGRLRPELYSGADARRLAELFAWGEKLCATGKALTAARVADTRAWETSGERSAADWLARLSGQTTGQAAQSLESARRLGDLPDVDAAARAGKLSAAQNTAVTTAATKAPDKTTELLDKAETESLVGLRERAQEIRLAADTAATERARYRAIHAGRYLRTWTDPDGSGRLTGRFTPDALAQILSALTPFQQHAIDTARTAGTRQRHECHAADALVALAHAATHPRSPTGVVDPAGGGEPAGGGAAAGCESTTGPSSSSCGSGGAGGGAWAGADRPDDDPTVWPDDPGRDPPGPADSPPGPDPKEPPPAQSSPSRARRPAMIIVRIDHAALIRGYRTADECCEIAGIGPVPVATVRAMMTDAFLAAIVTDGTDIRSVVHLGRQVTARQETALYARDPKCVVPGCPARTGLEIDHIDGWSRTQITTIDALARLCKHHHHQKTYDGWRLHGPPGHWQWTGPDDPDPPGGPPPCAPKPPDSPPGSCGRRDDFSSPSLFDTSEEPLPP